MRRLFYILTTVLMLLTAACSRDFDGGRDAADAVADGRAVFVFGVSACVDESDESDMATRSEDAASITSMQWTLADADGRVVTPLHSSLESDFSKLTVEGLRYGDYSIVFLASLSQSAAAAAGAPSTLTDVWLRNGDAKRALNEEWLYKRVDLHIGRGQSAVEQRIELERCVGRADVVLGMESEYVERFIRRVQVSFDGEGGFYTAMSADGRYSSAGSIKGEDVTAGRSFFTLPTREPQSGSVTVTAVRSDGSEFVRSYRFSGFEAAAGRVSRISVEYRHPEDESGTIYVREEDFARFGADTMFMADEPREIFYDNTRRWFRPDEPLQAAIDDNHDLRVRFYSPVAVRDVTVRCRFGKVSAEFFDLASFDVVYPFMEVSFPLPVTRSQRTFVAQDGRRVTVPAQPGLTNDDVEFEIVCDDDFMRKVSTIDSHWLVYYSPFQADEGHAYWRHMTPELCRHGVALTLNMAFMFSSPEFNAEMEKYAGRLLDNAGNPIDLGKLRETIRTHSGLTLGLVTGVGGLGGGRTYGLADYCYREVYWDWEQNPLANPHTYVRQAMFHEYGHCLGYSHDSTMTYGDVWTVLCAEVFVRMGSEGKLPVCSKNIIAGLPM